MASFCIVSPTATSVLLHQTMVDPRFVIRNTVWVRGTAVTNDAELHRQCGSLCDKIWTPSIANRGFIRETSETGQKMRHIEATFHCGIEGTKDAEVCPSAVKADFPADACHPSLLVPDSRATASPEVSKTRDT